MSALTNRAVPLVVLAILALALVACDGGDDDTGALPPPSTPSEGTTSMSKQEREDKVLADAKGLQPLLNDFWTAELQNVYQLSFSPPSRFAYYRGSGNPSCGAEAVAGANNAYYCFADNDEYVAFDLEWLQNYLIEFPGGATTFLVVAHEWGHAVQDTWLESGGGDTWDPAYRQELNADCLAGVFLRAEIDAGTIIEEAGDADAIWSWLYSGGGPWLDPSDHGTREQRVAAFTDGFTEGTVDCRTRY